MLQVPYNFCGDPDEPDYSAARVVLIPVPYGGTATYRAGAADGPRAILEASRNLETFDEELCCETIDAGIHSLQGGLPPDDAGQVVVEVEQLVGQAVDDGKFPIVLGGEHSVTVGGVRAFGERLENLSVLQIDAHADLRETYRGNPYNHACVGSCIRRICPLVQIGVRSLSAEEHPRTNRGNVSTFFMHLWKPQEDLYRVLDRLSDEVYVTIDLDALDPSIMPGTGTPEPGGFTWAEVTAILREVARQKQVVGFDVTELSPIPGSVVSEFTAAKLVYRFLGYIARGRGWV